MIVELLYLFWTFFKIGLFTFGGGYAMIPLIQSELVSKGLIEYDLLIDFIGISESTPGPIAVNMATFIGFSQHGIIGALFTTLGVILPSFIIIFLIAKFGSGLLKKTAVIHAFKGLRPTVIGLIISVSVILAIRSFLPDVDFKTFVFQFDTFNLKGFITFILIACLATFYKKLTPFKLILASVVIGMIIFSV